MTQCDMILNYMRETGGITPWEAIREFGCMRLGARIYDLRRRGITIKREMEHRENRYGKTVSFARYRVEE